MKTAGKLAVAGLVGLGIWVLTKRRAGAVPEPPAPAPVPEGGAGIEIQIIDALTGLPVANNSPAIVNEGGRYIVRFTVTNTSTRGGVPVGATLIFEDSGIGIVDPITGVPFGSRWSWAFGPGQTLTGWDDEFLVPDGSGGTSGEVSVRLFAPDGVTLLGSAREPLSIQVVPIIYGATVTIGV